MSRASNTFETEFLKLMFQNVGITGIGDATGLRGSASAGNFYLRLCKSTPAPTDANLGTECDYAGYTRVTVGRTISDWDVTNNVASNLNLLSFGECTSGSNTVRYVELWRDNVSTNESERIAWAMTSAQVSVAAGVSPVFQPGDITFTFD